MNEWCVCSSRKGELYLLTREEREHQLNLCSAFQEPVPSYVVKVFDKLEDAMRYVKNIRDVNKIISEL